MPEVIHDNRRGRDKGRAKPFLPFLIIAFLALVITGVTFFTAGTSVSGYRLTVNPAYLEHNGIRVERPGQTFNGVSAEYAETVSALTTVYQGIGRTLARLSNDLELSQASPAGATAIIRNLEGDALSAVATLGAMPDSAFKEAYTAHFLYAATRLGELTSDPTAERLWTAARELFVR